MFTVYLSPTELPFFALLGSILFLFQMKSAASTWNVLELDHPGEEILNFLNHLILGKESIGFFCAELCLGEIED